MNEYRKGLTIASDPILKCFYNIKQDIPRILLPKIFLTIHSSTFYTEHALNCKSDSFTVDLLPPSR